MPTPLPTLHDWRLSVDYEGIAWALMDREGERVNSMGRRFTEELGETVKWTEMAAIHGEIKGLVLMSAKPTGFLVGADIREFSRFATEPQVKEVVKETLGLLNREGLSLVLVEQKAPLALELARRAYLLSVGRVVRTLEPGELTSYDELAQHYLA